MAGPVSNAAHVKGFIRKPFELRELVVLVREALSGYSSVYAPFFA
jgi:hypothetical protein